LRPSHFIVSDSNLSSNPADLEKNLRDDENRDVMPKGITIQGVGIHRDYLPSWVRKDAFREFYQNWYVEISNYGPSYFCGYLLLYETGKTE
jgi:hypothetical protein